jgi:N-methylhydantoinase A/oxoprolinase/acetone carboxylase beta subunit
VTGWQFRADRGGTFTDIVARRPDGRLTPLVITRGFGDALRIGLHELLLRRYVRHVGDALEGVRSNGGMARMSQLAGFDRVIGFDVGGTSTDDSRFAGGEPGALGANRVEHADGTVTGLGGSGSADVVTGDVLVIETPGGGGYGPPSPDPHQAGEEIDDLRAF